MVPIPELPISLRAWPSKDGNLNDALPTLIQRINAERGGFRNLTEESLLQEIAETGADKDDASSDEEEEEQKPDRAEQLSTARVEMMAQLDQAHSGASLALNLLSILLAKDSNSDAAGTIDPYLRGQDLAGKLGARKIAVAPIPAADKQDNQDVCRGWKIQNLNKAVDSILAAASRLEQEIGVETKYWEQVLDVDKNGWSIYSLPREKHTLAVTYGFSESTPAFKHRGLAALRRDAEGNMSLDQGAVSREPQVIRVRIRSDGHETGSTAVPPPISDDASIEAHLLQSRNTLFSEELWQEVNREARGLLPFGVFSKEGTIICPLSPGKFAVLDLVPLQDGLINPTRPDDKVAEGISLALHLLLSYAHRTKYQTRTQPLTPSVKTMVPSNPYSLLRPIITRIGYQNNNSHIHKFFNPLCEVLRQAGLAPTWFTNSVTQAIEKLSPAEATILALTDRLQTLTEFEVTPDVKITIRSMTSIYPVAGTIHYMSLQGERTPLQLTCKPPPATDSWKAVEEYVLFAASSAAISSFAASRPVGDPFRYESGWSCAVQPNKMRKKFEGGKSKELTFEIHRVKRKGDGANAVKAVVEYKWLGEDERSGYFRYEWLEQAQAKSIGNMDWDDGEGEVVKTLKEVIAQAGMQAARMPSNPALAAGFTGEGGQIRKREDDEPID